MAEGCHKPSLMGRACILPAGLASSSSHHSRLNTVRDWLTKSLRPRGETQRARNHTSLRASCVLLHPFSLSAPGPSLVLNCVNPTHSPVVAKARGLLSWPLPFSVLTQLSGVRTHLLSRRQLAQSQGLAFAFCWVFSFLNLYLKTHVKPKRPGYYSHASVHKYCLISSSSKTRGKWGEIYIFFCSGNGIFLKTSGRQLYD